MANATILGLLGKPECEGPNTPRPVVLGKCARPSRKRFTGHENTSFERIGMAKRSFDLSVALVGLMFIAPISIFLAVLILLIEGGPIFYVSERMKTPKTSFKLIKFRTMYVAVDDQNAGATGGDKAGRVTPMGRVLRRLRLDEIPQILNVLIGDMSFVGPRPPLRQYTDAFPEIYAAVLRSRPGVTGLATLHYHRHEERLIARSKSPVETDKIYATRCIPRKAALDLIYQRHASVWFDAVIMWKTIRCLMKR